MKIYTVTGLSTDDEIGSRVFGWYSELEYADEAVLDNTCDIHECAYDYVVVEKISEGVFVCAHEEWWYRWDELNKKYVRTTKPEAWINQISFGIG